MIWSSSAKLRKFWQIIFEASNIIDPHVGTASKAKSPPVTQTVPDQESANLLLGEKDPLEVFGFNHPVASKRLSTRSRKNEKNVKVNHPNCNYKELDSEKKWNHQPLILLLCFWAGSNKPQLLLSKAVSIPLRGCPKNWDTPKSDLWPEKP